MPLPRLLKRLSERNLRKRSQSIKSNSIDDEQGAPSRSTSEPPPPLPPPKSPQSQGSFPSVTSAPTVVGWHAQSTPPLLPNGSREVTNSLMALPPSLPQVNGYSVENDKELDAAWAVANKAPPVSKTDKVLQKIEVQVSGFQAANAENAAVVTGVTAVLEATGGMQAIEQGINHFLEGSTVFMNALDEVSKLHPFLGVAVMAFKTVWTLEMKRRENDKRIIALHVEMKDMMGVLLQLKGVKDVETSAPDGTTIKGRLQELAKGTADDIKLCGNTCETYSKKKLVAKVLNGPIWEKRLLKFVDVFTTRRSQFEFALTIHTARGIDSANQTLGDLDKTANEVNAKMDMMMKMFERFVLPEQKEMALLVDQKGGVKACQGNEKFLRDLSDFEQKTMSTSGSTSVSASGSRGGRKTGAKTDLDELMEDLHTDPDEAIEKNMKTFSRKFEVQKRQIVEEVERVVRRESDRVISAVTSGPHDKIVDKDVHKIWKEMGWRGSVKARHFVLALRDHFHEKWHSNQATEGTEAIPLSPAVEDRKADEWALAYLDVVRLQPISEAFDDDASGFVTVAEANTLTTSRPLGWSLPHWLAYWAVGWHQTMAVYVTKIRGVIGKMFAILPRIKPENQTSVNEYLLTIYENVTTLECSVNGCYLNDALQARFKMYVDAEEERLKANLEAVDYDIDAMDTLALVTGPGRIERFVLPLLYLLLKRHFEIFRVCQTATPHPDELWDAADTIVWVFDAVVERVNVLKTIFKQQKLDIEQQFKTFAHGLFEYWNEPSGLWAPSIVRETDPPDYPYNDDLEEKDVKTDDILNYPLDEQKLDYTAYDLQIHESATNADASLPLRSVLGTWNGYIYSGAKALAGMISFTLSPLTAEGQSQSFEASGRSNGSDFKLSGQCSFATETDIITVTFKRVFPTRYATQYWHGELDTTADVIIGKWGFDPDHTTHLESFILKRTLPEYLCFRATPMVFETNKIRTLWSFALSAVRHHVRRQSWSWSFFSERRDTRERFIDLFIRNTEFGKPLDEDEEEEFSRIRQSLTSADSRFYHSLAAYKIRISTLHGRSCDSCHGNIGGARIICLFCQTKDTWNAVDLCERSECVEAQIVRDDLTRPHLPTHDMIKVRRVVHIRQIGQLERAAKEALENARAIFAKDQPVGIGESSRSPDNNTLTDCASLGRKDGLKCLRCEDRLMQPCWYCVQCQDDTFICNNCDAKGRALFRDYEGAHVYDTHDLVRCQELVEDIDVSVEERLAKLEEQFTNHEKVMDERLARLETKVDDRLSRMTELLEAVLGKRGGDNLSQNLPMTSPQSSFGIK